MTSIHDMPYVDFPTRQYMPVVADAKYLGGYKLHLTFDNGEKRVIDLEGKLDGGVFEPLKDKGILSKIFGKRMDGRMAK